jgi:hypothetical protein
MRKMLPIPQFAHEGAEAAIALLALPSGKNVSVRTQFLRFNAWRGKPVTDTYGGKTILNIGGEPLFAELAVLRMLEKEGFEGVWVDTFGKRFRRTMTKDSCVLPAWVKTLYDGIAAGNGQRTGCWDVVGWKNNNIIFVETKRKGKDRIRASQLKWLESALHLGIAIEAFSVCEWDLIPT